MRMPAMPGPDAFADHAPHGHHAAMSRVAVHHDRKAHRLRDPAGDLHALRHRERADIGEPGIGADDAARAHEARFASGFLHDARMRGGRRMQHGEDLVGALDERLESFRFRVHLMLLQLDVRRTSRRSSSARCQRRRTGEASPASCRSARRRRAPRRATTSAAFAALASSAFSLSTIGAGVPPGANHACQVLLS